MSDLAYIIGELNIVAAHLEALALEVTPADLARAQHQAAAGALLLAAARAGLVGAGLAAELLVIGHGIPAGAARGMSPSEAETLALVDAAGWSVRGVLAFALVRRVLFASQPGLAAAIRVPLVGELALRADIRADAACCRLAARCLQALTTPTAADGVERVPVTQGEDDEAIVASLEALAGRLGCDARTARKLLRPARVTRVRWRTSRAAIDRVRARLRE